MYNITTKAISNTATLHLVDPATDTLLYADDAETKPLEIVVSGKASKAYRAALSALSRKSLARKGKATSFEQNVQDNNELLAAISVEAKNFDLGDGIAINTYEKFVELYSTPSLYWIRDAVQSFLEQTENFSQK